MKKGYIICLVIFLIFILSGTGFSLWDEGHKRSAVEAVTYMEKYGSNQQRWASEYLKAKIGGRDTGESFNGNDGGGNRVGLVGVLQSGAVAPDYAQDLWWDDTTTWNWKIDIPGYGATNFSSWTHFMNLNKKSDENETLVTNNYNDFDGWGYNATYGFEVLGIDSTVATFMNDAWMSVDLANCGDCGDKYTFIPAGNPAIDYKQNGATTPVSSGSGGNRLEKANGMNYNCFSDTNWAGVGNCPDSGFSRNGKSADCDWFSCGEPVDGAFQRPGDYANYALYGHPCSHSDGECGPGKGNPSEGNEDWVIFEPVDNAATFYYNEFFLEGGASRNSTFNEDSVTERYYDITNSGINYLAIALHYGGDVNAQVHIHVTTGYNHSAYEEWIESRLDSLVDYNDVTAFIKSRSNHEKADIDEILTENAFLTYLARYRSNYDILLNTGDVNRFNAAKYGINHSVATLVLMLEKGVMDLRKYRQ